jgi:hypothetical protein
MLVALLLELLTLCFWAFIICWGVGFALWGLCALTEGIDNLFKRLDKPIFASVDFLADRITSLVRRWLHRPA